MAAGTVTLRVANLSVRYGRFQAVRDVSFDVAAATCVGLLGPNGAGKSSVLRAVSGGVARSGTIELDGRRIVGRTDRVVRSGIGHVLEGRHIFAGLSVQENLQLARFGCTDGRFGERLTWLLEFFPVLREKLGQSGAELSGGQQQILAIARALLTGPRVLLLDEPSLGLAPIVIEQLATALPEMMREWDLTVVLAEQFLYFVTAVASEVHVLQHGQIVYSGSPRESAFNASLVRTYLTTQVSGRPGGSPSGAGTATG